MVLVNAWAELAMPTRPAPQLVEVSPFIHQYVPGQDGVARDVVTRHLNLAHLREIQETILNICHSKIMHKDRIGNRNISVLRNT
ncbi:hypothetical protein THSYN_04735 [Candidatus Thiodictyon syntrophicum]|uniref:Uncharacterized protein n=1 Tax=Candidatus Thiodictyon syntrophicum TaxID=1166950 RepID=A0A2K8U444_9GAMM|nr:hypothetical protein THSYN_04735 [Candidatus Thiodictyon syntrophicum]